jgi:hypothetical protein
MGATIDVVGIDFGMTGGWGGWPLFYSRYGMSVALDSTNHPTIIIWQDGLPSGWIHGLTSWRGLEP